MRGVWEPPDQPGLRVDAPGKVRSILGARRRYATTATDRREGRLDPEQRPRELRCAFTRAPASLLAGWQAGALALAIADLSCWQNPSSATRTAIRLARADAVVMEPGVIALLCGGPGFRRRHRRCGGRPRAGVLQQCQHVRDIELVPDPANASSLASRPACVSSSCRWREGHVRRAPDIAASPP
jgi:hypothetical protein